MPRVANKNARPTATANGTKSKSKNQAMNDVVAELLAMDNAPKPSVFEMVSMDVQETPIKMKKVSEAQKKCKAKEAEAPKTPRKKATKPKEVDTDDEVDEPKTSKTPRKKAKEVEAPKKGKATEVEDESPKPKTPRKKATKPKEIDDDELPKTPKTPRKKQAKPKEVDEDEVEAPKKGKAKETAAPKKGKAKPKDVEDDEVEEAPKTPRKKQTKPKEVDEDEAPKTPKTPRKKTTDKPKARSDNHPYQLHLQKACGLNSRMCRYCHPEVELVTDDATAATKCVFRGRDERGTIATMLEMENRYRHKFSEEHYDDLERTVQRKALAKMVKTRMENRLRVIPKNDGYQTPYVKHGVDVACHGCGVCCRVCAYLWHKMPMDRDLNDVELAYLGNVLTIYITEVLMVEGPVRKWMREREEGRYYTPGVYCIRYDDGDDNGAYVEWSVKRKKGEIVVNETNWDEYIRKYKTKCRKAGKDFDLLNMIMNDDEGEIEETPKTSQKKVKELKTPKAPRKKEVEKASKGKGKSKEVESDEEVEEPKTKKQTKPKPKKIESDDEVDEAPKTPKIPRKKAAKPKEVESDEEVEEQKTPKTPRKKTPNPKEVEKEAPKTSRKKAAKPKEDEPAIPKVKEAPRKKSKVQESDTDDEEDDDFVDSGSRSSAEAHEQYNSEDSDEDDNEKYKVHVPFNHKLSVHMDEDEDAELDGKVDGEDEEDDEEDELKEDDVPVFELDQVQADGEWSDGDDGYDDDEPDTGAMSEMLAHLTAGAKTNAYPFPLAGGR